jgi:hypothetical protein
LYFQGDEDKSNFAKFIDIIKKSKKGKTTGIFSKDNYKSGFAEAWKIAIKRENFDNVNLLFKYT